MPTTEEFLVHIRTIFDGTGAKEAQQSVQQLTRGQQIANDILKQLMGEQAATMRNYNAAVRSIAKSGGVAPTLGPGAFGIAAGGAGGAAGGLGEFTRLAGLGTGLYAVHNVMQGIVGYLGDSVELLREHQRGLAASSVEVGKLDDAFRNAAKSGDDLQITIGRLAAPAAQSGLQASSGLLDGLNDKLTDITRAASNLRDAAPWLFEGIAGGLAGLPGVGPALQSAAAAGKSLQDEERLLARRRQERQQDVRERRLLEINELPRATEAQAALQVGAMQAARALTDAKQQQLDVQHEAVDLAAQEASILLGMLPAQQAMAEVQRTITEQMIRARQAALPASERLEDLQYEQQRARLLLQMRGLSPEARYSARQELRTLGRAEPGVALAALEAGRPLVLAGRAAERVGMEAQLFQVSTERQLAQINEAQTTNSLLAQIAAQRTQAISLTINMGTEQFRTEFHAALQAAENTSSNRLAGS